MSLRISACPSLLLAALLFLGLPSDVSAQEAPSTVSVIDVLTSIEQHPQVMAQMARVEAARSLVMSAEGGFDPTLAVGGSLNMLGYYEYGRLDALLTQATPVWGTQLFAGYRLGRGFSRPMPVYYGETETLTEGELRAGLRIPLLQDGPIDPRRAAIWRAEQSRTIAETEMAERILRVTLSGVQAYYRWVAANLKYQIVSDWLALARLRDGQLESRVAAGAIAAFERLENQRSLLERQTALVGAQRELERAAIALSLFLRDENGTPRVLNASQSPRQIDGPIQLPATEQEAQELAADQRPEISRFVARIESARIALELANNQILPRLDLGLMVSADLGTDQGSVRTTLGAPNFEASLQFRIPLLLREARGRADAQAAELRALERERDFMLEQLHAEIAEAYVVLETSRQQYDLALESRNVAQQVATGERQRFDQGLSSMLIVNLREQSAAQAELSLVDAEAAVRVAEWLTRTALGEDWRAAGR